MSAGPDTATVQPDSGRAKTNGAGQPKIQIRGLCDDCR